MGMLRRDPLLSLDNAGTPRGVRHEVNYAVEYGVQEAPLLQLLQLLRG